MKTKNVEDLLARTGECDPNEPSDWDEFDEDELRWLKDHNRLPQKVEAAKFTAVWDGGDGITSEPGEYIGDEGTRFSGFAAGIATGEDLSNLPPGEARRREKDALQARIEQIEAEEAALAAGGDESEEDEYDDMDVAALKAEVDRRNREYAAEEIPEGEQPFQLPKPARKGQLIAVLREDDVADEDETPQ